MWLYQLEPMRIEKRACQKAVSIKLFHANVSISFE